MPAPPEDDDKLARSIHAFGEFLFGEKRASPHTVSAYRRDLGQLAAFVRERTRGPARLEDVTKLLLRAWLGELARTRSATSIARKLAAVRAFFAWLERRGTIRENPTALLSSPKLGRKLPRFLSPSAAAEVVEAPLGQTGRAAERLRDAAALELLYGCGLRVSELVGLDLDDLSFEEEQLRVLGKGKKERIVPLGDKAKGATLAYLAERPVLRHPKSGAQDGRALLLGHSSLSTTQRYTHLSLDQLLGVYDRAHPLAKKRRGSTHR